MKIYISGSIHGQPDEGAAKFRQVAERVAAFGHVAVVPHDIPAIHGDHEPGEGCPPAYSKGAACYMRGDLATMLKHCDAVLMIGEWHHSVGAQREHSVACWTGMPIYYSVNALPDNRPVNFMNRGG